MIAMVRWLDSVGAPRNEQREQKPDMTFHKTLIGLYALVLQDPSASVFWVGF